MRAIDDLITFASWDATELARRIAAGDLTADEALDCSLAIAALIDDRINAFVDLEEAVAREGVSKAGAGPLWGVPIAMKDCLGAVAGARRYYGSRLTKGDRLAADDEIVRRFRALGLVPFGTTNVPELSSSITTESLLHGPCRNPWNLGHSVGGSGGGGAAAVAFGAVPLAYGNDSAGSIRIPASCCGLFGLKPSRGRVPTGPQYSEIWFGMMAQHVITRSVRDSALVLDHIEGVETGAPYAAPAKRGLYADTLAHDPARLRIAVSNGAANDIAIADDCAEALADAAALLSDLGHEVIEASPAYAHPQLCTHLSTLLAVSLAMELPATAAENGRQVNAASVEACNLAMAARGEASSARQLAEALDFKNAMARRLGVFMTDFDVLLTPTLARPPIPLGYLNANQADSEDYLQKKWTYGAFTPLANLAGVPSATVPLHVNQDGLPVGVLLTAAYGREDVLFALSGQLERARPWQQTKPALNICHYQPQNPSWRPEPHLA
ncbi:MAG: amidase [Pseudomonadota bacterium]